MMIAVHGDFSVHIRRLRAEHLAILQALPMALAAANPFWTRDPVSGPDDDTTRAVREDWENFVQPELRSRCEGEIAVFLADVADAQADPVEAHDPLQALAGGDDDDHIFFPEDEGPYHRIPIRPEHVEPWYGALNQARLAIESVHGFGSGLPPFQEIENWPVPRQAAFWQSRLYGAIQEALLGCMEAKFGQAG